MATASKRGSDSILQDYRAIVEAVRNSEIMRRQWDNYRKDFDYASTISFDEVCDAVASTMDTLITNNFLIKLCSRQTFLSAVFFYLKVGENLNQNWIVENLNNAFSTWNGKLGELWGLVTTGPQTFKGGAVWSVMQTLHKWYGWHWLCTGRAVLCYIAM